MRRFFQRYAHLILCFFAYFLISTQIIYAEFEPVEISVQQGHCGPVNDIAFSPDGKWFASASDDTTVKVWRYSDNKLLRTLKGHNDKVTCLAFSPDGNLIATGGDDEILNVWRFSDGKNLVSQNLGASVKSVAFSPDGMFLGSFARGEVFLWQITKGIANSWRAGRELKGQVCFKSHYHRAPSGRPCKIEFSPDGRYIAYIAKEDGNNPQLNVIRLKDKEVVFSKGVPYSWADDLAFTPNGNFLATEGRWKPLVWRFPSGEEIKLAKEIPGIGVPSLAAAPRFLIGCARLYQFHHYFSDDSYIPCDESVSFSLDGKFLAYGGCGRFDVWSLEGQDLVKSYHTDCNEKVIKFGPDVKAVLAGDGDGSISSYGFSSIQRKSSQRIHPLSIRSVHLNQEGKGVAVGIGLDKRSLCLLEVASGKILWTIEGHKKEINDVEFSPDGRYFVSAGDDYAVKIWSTGDGELIETLKGPWKEKDSEQFNEIEWSRDGSVFAVITGDNTVKVRNAVTWQLRSMLDFDELLGKCSYQPGSLSLSHDGRLLALETSCKSSGFFGWAERYSDEINVWNIEKKEPKKIDAVGEKKWRDPASSWITWRDFDCVIKSKIEAGENPRDIRIQKEGRFIFTSDEESISVKKFSEDPAIARGEELARLADGGRVVGASSDGRYFAVARKKNLTVWDLRELDAQTEETSIKKGTPSNIRLAEFSPDGRHLLLERRGRIEIWNLESGSPSGTIGEEGASVNCMAFRGESGRLIAGYGDGTVRLWNFETRELIKEIKAHGESVEILATSDDGDIFATGSEEGSVKLWRGEKGKRFRKFPKHEKGIKFIVVSGDGEIFVSGNENGDIWLGRSEEEEPLVALNLQDAQTAFLGEGGERLYLVGKEETKVFDIRTKELTGKKEGIGNFRALDIHPNTQMLAIGTDDLKINLWSVRSSKVIHTFSGIQEKIETLRFSPDGKRLASVSEDGLVRLWDIEKRAPLVSIVSLSASKWLVFQEEGLFDCSDDMKNFVVGVQGTKIFGTSQFFNAYHRPGLLSSVY